MMLLFPPLDTLLVTPSACLVMLRTAADFRVSCGFPPESPWAAHVSSDLLVPGWGEAAAAHPSPSTLPPFAVRLSIDTFRRGTTDCLLAWFQLPEMCLLRGINFTLVKEVEMDRGLWQETI